MLPPITPPVVTEADWFRSKAPTRMLEFLGDRLSDRKMRLFDCACCRRIWDLMADERSWRAVEAAEVLDDAADFGRVMSDAVAASEDATAAMNSALTEAGLSDTFFPHVYDPRTAGYACRMDAALAAASALRGRGGSEYAHAPAATAWASADAVARPQRYAGPYYLATPTYWAVEHEEYAVQADLLRDIVGNPFRPATCDASWRTSTVLALAAGIYEERAFDRCPILADALMDAGCEHDILLQHLRGPGPHVRGCWVLDLLVGKE